jgi:peptide/nickel transport system permease protein
MIRLSSLGSGLRRIAARPLGLCGLILVVCFILVGALADVLSPANPVIINIAAKFADPSHAHWLGTDQLGRDVFSRVIVGTRISLVLALSSVFLSVMIGTALGMAVAYAPAWFDALMVLVFDTIRSFPTIMFGLAVVTLFGPSIQAIIGIVVATTCPSYARLVRTQSMSLRSAEFIVAENAMGATLPRVLIYHTLPNVIGPVLIVASMDVPFVIAIEASLSFLGLGIRPPTPSWGTILNDGFSFIRNTPWILLAGGVPLVLTTVGFTFLGEALRDAFDPKLRRDLP